MKFAVIGDIHGNKFALESTLKDIKDKNVDFIVSTGDLVGYLPFPNEVIEMIKSNNIITIQGNHDEKIALGSKPTEESIGKMSESEIQGSASGVFTNLTITDENREYLKRLPKKMVIVAEALKVMLVHGSPRSNKEYMKEDSEILDLLAKESHADVIISGHTHLPYYKKVEDKHFINAGSTGKPKQGNANGVYVIVDIDHNEVTCDIVEVPYDVENMVAAIEGNDMISNELIDNLRKGY
ncbi:putative phosphoesterase [Natranaerovirga pectinivora]|uniref:Phosphoesterase n=1 Tax=Natranaerovirga pectinivora TaxID=682400 RepID=A0A4R3MQE5_9FIRM|nr:YfcE family phosphodiesterase [Natranaerovirga pectinivora]TCT15391.1 putative phosphoesterase [Natranaerovirga pectinivora]